MRIPLSVPNRVTSRKNKLVNALLHVDDSFRPARRKVGFLSVKVVGCTRNAAARELTQLRDYRYED